MGENYARIFLAHHRNESESEGEIERSESEHSGMERTFGVFFVTDEMG